MITAVDAEVLWPEIRRHLLQVLAARRCTGFQADDLVQEAALHLLRSQETFDDVAGLKSWLAQWVRWRHVDAVRRSGGEQRWLDEPSRGMEAIPTSEPTPEDQAVLREEWARTLQALATLSRQDQEALAAVLRPTRTDTEDRKEAVKWSVRRHRARTRLMAALEAAVGVALGWLGLRALRDRVGTAVVAASIAAPLALGVGLMFGPPSADWAPDVSSGAPPMSRNALAWLPQDRQTWSEFAIQSPSVDHVDRSANERTDGLPEPPGATEVYVPGTEIGVSHEHRDKTPEDSLLCVRDLLVVARVCTSGEVETTPRQPNAVGDSVRAIRSTP